MIAPTAHELSHSTATIKYKDKLIGTFNPQYSDLNNVKYTIMFNDARTQAWHFWVSKDIFFKWEAPTSENEAVEVELKAKNKELSSCYQTFKPIEVKNKN